MDYKEAIEHMEEAGKYGSMAEEKRMKELCRRLGNPQEGMETVDIAGENGKSSVIAYLSAIMKYAGYKAGCYTARSDFAGGYTAFGAGEYRERMQVNGRKITKQEFADCMGAVWETAEAIAAEGEKHPVPAEMEAAAALLYFRRKGCHILFLEDGTDGDKDGMAMVTEGKMTVLTSRASVFLGRQSSAEGQNLYPVRKVRYGIEKQRFSYREYDNLEICMGGRFQVENAALAIEAVKGLEKLGFTVSERQLRKGLATADRKGCFTVLKKRPYFIVDSAHNEKAAGRLAESVRFCVPGKRIICIFGGLRDEPYHEMLSGISELAEHIITVTVPGQAKAAHAYELAQTAAEFHPMVTAADSLEEAAELGFLLADKEGVIVAFGSPFYLGTLVKIVEKRIKVSKN